MCENQNIFSDCMVSMQRHVGPYPVLPVVCKTFAVPGELIFMFVAFVQDIVTKTVLFHQQLNWSINLSSCTYASSVTILNRPSWIRIWVVQKFSCLWKSNKEYIWGMWKLLQRKSHPVLTEEVSAERGQVLLGVLFGGRKTASQIQQQISGSRTFFCEVLQAWTHLWDPNVACARSLTILIWCISVVNIAQVRQH